MKDESWTLKTCLESMKDVVDEIIIVDTGSQDNSVALAESLGARVYSYEWDGDFGRARNHSMSHAVGDYVLYIDADEYLDAKDKWQLRTFLQQHQPDGADVQLVNYVGTISRQTATIPISVTRLFRRGYQFTGAIHEQIRGTIEESHGIILAAPLTIHHVGYLEEFVTKKNKIARNIEIIQRELDHAPDDLFQRTNLLAEYNRNNDHKKAVPLAEEIVSTLKKIPGTRWPVFSQRVFQHQLNALEGTGQTDAALQSAHDAARYFPNVPEFQKRHGDLLTRTGRYQEAHSVLTQCIEKGEIQNAGIDMLRGFGSFYAAASLGTLWLELGDAMSARKWFTQAFFSNPRLELALIPVLCLMPPEPHLLREHIEAKLSDIQTAGTYAEIYAARGILDAADVIQRLEQRFSATPLTMRARVAVALHSGQGVAGIQAIVDQIPIENNWLLLGLVNWELGDFKQAHFCFSRAGERGEVALSLLRIDTSESQDVVNILPIFRDLTCARAETVARRLILRVSDRNEVWQYFKMGPLKHIFEQITWPGDTLHECEENALHAFKSRDLETCLRWLEKAESFNTTITTAMIRCDLMLAQGNTAEARKALFKVKQMFPDSEMIKIVSPQVFGSLKLA